jgi:hypothetical protein
LEGISDFIEMGGLGISIAGEPFARRGVFGSEHTHVVLGGESFVALTQSLQYVLWAQRNAPGTRWITYVEPAAGYQMESAYQTPITVHFDDVKRTFTWFDPPPAVTAAPHVAVLASLTL